MESKAFIAAYSGQPILRKFDGWGWAAGRITSTSMRRGEKKLGMNCNVILEDENGERPMKLTEDEYYAGDDTEGDACAGAWFLLEY